MNLATRVHNFVKVFDRSDYNYLVLALFVMFLSMCDIMSTYIGVFVFGLAEQNPIAVYMFDTVGFFITGYIRMMIDLFLMIIVFMLPYRTVVLWLCTIIMLQDVIGNVLTILWMVNT